MNKQKIHLEKMCQPNRTLSLSKGKWRDLRLLSTQENMGAPFFAHFAKGGIDTQRIEETK
jgi:hypothetical protein